jgi:hypothetical protein
MVWCVQGLLVNVPSGRQRRYGLVALNALARERFTVDPLTSMTTETVGV